jgi:TyrR family helix-turn-helix protein
LKVEIESSDRLGISQEILSIFSLNSWNLKAIEVETCFTYVSIESPNVDFHEIKEALKETNGIINCCEIDFMPSEKRENHLHALLARIPDPIIDIDEKGVVLVINQAIKEIVSPVENNLVGKSIVAFIDCTLDALLKPIEHSLSITFYDRPFIADILPVYSKKRISGAVISLRSIDKLGRQIALMQSSTDGILDNIVGKSEKLQSIMAQTLRFAELDLPVLITGDTGTGKELIARALHQESSRKEAPFLTINCASLPEQLLESELFGYESGAFTGAARGGKPGLFELANGGTVFLDEVAEMSVYLQAKLLRFLQDYSFRRLGGVKELTANIKIISASHQNFTELIQKKLFREDLYYRLNVLSLALPALNQRVEDIPLLVEHFVKNAARQVEQEAPILTPSALSLLQTYQWPGNIRQLENSIFRLVALNTKRVIQRNDVEDILSVQSFDKNDEIDIVQYESFRDWSSAQESFEKALLLELYPSYPSTRKLAERLKVSHNKIAMKLRAYKIPS